MIFQCIKTFLQKENIAFQIVLIALLVVLVRLSREVMLPSTNLLLGQETTAFQVSLATMPPSKHYKRKIIRHQNKELADYN